MPIEWRNLAFSEQAEAILDMFDGLTEEDRATIYDEWEQQSFLDHPMGRIQALTELQMIAQRRYLDKCGKGDAYNKLQESWLAQKGTK